MSRIFISYRRADSGVITGRIYDRLATAFGAKNVFKDVNDIPYGVDFREYINNEVGAHDAVLVIIGPQWVSVTEEDGTRRLDNPRDFVRIEIETALKRGNLVVPVLVMGASMPDEGDLPDSLRAVAYRNSIPVRNDPDFHSDMTRLINDLKRTFSAPKPSMSRRSLELYRVQRSRRVGVAVIVVLLMLVVSAALLLSGVLDEDEGAGESLTSAQQTETAVALLAPPATDQSTDTPTGEPSDTPTDKPTPTDTSSPSDTPTTEPPATRTPTDEPSDTPTDEPTPTDTSPPSDTPTDEPTAIPTRTPTPSDTPTDEPTAIPTLTPTPTPTDTPAHTPTPTLIAAGTNNDIWRPLIAARDGIAMAYVPAGCFMMGSEDGDPDERPVHEACVDAFWIDVTEVTNAQYGEGGLYPREDQPYVGVSWFDAEAFCESRGGRLPTEAEWAFAARGPSSLIYPWGDEFNADYTVYTENSNFGPARVGTRPEGASWVGALDMSGNVWEWVADWYADSYYADSLLNPLGPTFGTQRAFRGGSWDNFDTDVRPAERFKHNPETATATTLGFRCVIDADD